MLKIDYSRQNTYNKCPRLYELQYVMHLSPPEGNAALRHGSVYHAMHEGLNTGIMEGLSQKKATELGIAFGERTYERISENEDFDKDDFRNINTTKALFNLYIRTHMQNKESLLYKLFNNKDDYYIIGTERYFSHKCEADGAPYLLEGVVDRTTQTPGILLIEDYKTASQYVGTVRKYLPKSPQHLIYAFMYQRTEGAYPQMGVYDIGHASQRVNLKLELHREELIMNPVDIEDVIVLVDNTVKNIYNNKIMSYFPRNLNNCSNIFGTCPFAKLCEIYKDSTEDLEHIAKAEYGYITKEWNPAEQTELLHQIKQELL